MCVSFSYNAGTWPLLVIKDSARAVRSLLKQLGPDAFANAVKDVEGRHESPPKFPLRTVGDIYLERVAVLHMYICTHKLTMHSPVSNYNPQYNSDLMFTPYVLRQQHGIKVTSPLVTYDADDIQDEQHVLFHWVNPHAISLHLYFLQQELTMCLPS